MGPERGSGVVVAAEDELLGVGGGIVAVVPDELTLCVWSPALDETGNSALGRRALEVFVAETGLSVF
jgi:glutaminase